MILKLNIVNIIPKVNILPIILGEYETILLISVGNKITTKFNPIKLTTINAVVKILPKLLDL